jgi:hypothetical protein
MLSAAYAIIGLKMIDGESVVAPELFEAKGELQVRALRAGGREWGEPDDGESPPSPDPAVESAS